MTDDYDDYIPDDYDPSDELNTLPREWPMPKVRTKMPVEVPQPERRPKMKLSLLHYGQHTMFEQYPTIRVLVEGKMVSAQIKDARRYHYCSLWYGEKFLGDWSWKSLALALAANEVIKG